MVNIYIYYLFHFMWQMIIKELVSLLVQLVYKQILSHFPLPWITIQLLSQCQMVNIMQVITTALFWLVNTVTFGTPRFSQNALLVSLHLKSLSGFLVFFLGSLKLTMMLLYALVLRYTCKIFLYEHLCYSFFYVFCVLYKPWFK